ncbi:MAG: hypothetical protein AMJ46_10915 [Latescibacteria bacterium DG_63]|nr:MAG: hypothetical protein AMJ46_10915 [Latescibacteria bacterium DG_63]
MFDELKKLLKQSAIYGIGSIVTPFIGFVMLPVYSRYLTPAEYGVLAVTAVVIAFLSVLIALGISSGLLRFYFAYGKRREKDEVIISSLLFSLFSSAVFILVLWSFAFEISELVFDFENGELFFKLVIFTAALNTGITNCLAVLRAEEKPVVYSTITVLRLVLTFSLNIVFVVVLRRNVQGILEAGLVSGAVSYAVVAAIVLKGRAFSMSWTKIKEVLAYGLPLVPGGVAALVLTLCDRYFLKHFATMEDVGLYSVGFRVASALRIAVIEPFRIAWPPYMLSVVERAEAKDIYKKVFVYFTFIAVWAGLGLSLFAQEGLRILTTPAYYSAYRVVPLLVISYVLFGMCAVLVAGIHITKKTKYASYSFMTAALVSLLLNYVLVPRFGMMGAAVASVAAYVTLCILYFTMSQRFYRIEHEFGRIALIFIAGLALYGICAFATSGRGVSAAVVIKTVCLLLYPVLLYFGRFFRKEEIARIRELLHLRKKTTPH